MIDRPDQRSTGRPTGPMDGKARNLAVEYRPLGDLIPYAKNARTHSDEHVAQIAASIREFGWTNPVLVDGDNGIIAGHGRVLAARKLGMTTVPVIELAGLSEIEKRAYIIADNKIALNAGWDKEMLSVELADLDALGFDLSLTGFGGDELAGLLNFGNRGLTDPDEIPETPDEPVTRMGDVWVMGSHRLVCGDSTSPVGVAKVLAGVKPHLMVTDPPYGVNYDPSWRQRFATGGGNGDLATGAVLNDDRADWREAWSLFPGDVAYVWHGALHAGEVAASLEAAGFGIRTQIIWDKTRLVIGRGDYHWQHEPLFHCVRRGRSGHWEGGRNQTTVWQIPHRKSASGHGTEKPVECMKRPIENNSSPGQAVYEPFSGSGTTIIAAEITGRSCHAIELNPAYVDVAVRRWQDFTGETLRRHYREELDTGQIKATATVAESLFRKATGDGSQSVTAAIFWLRIRGGWRETPQDHRVGHYDVQQLSDEDLEQMIVEHQVALGYPALPAPGSGNRLAHDG